MKAYLNITKALADRSRMRIVAALMSHDELCVCQIVELLRFATPTVSRHMAVLQGAHIVQSRKDGRWVYYRLSGDFPVQLRRWFIDSLLNTEQIKEDQVLLEGVVACDPEDLCRHQKKRKECDE